MVIKFIALQYTVIMLLTFTVQFLYSEHVVLPYLGAPNAICFYNGTVYVFGFENSSKVPRAFAISFDVQNNNVVKIFNGSFGGFYNCIVYEDKIYVVGFENISNVFSWALTIFSSSLHLERMVLENLSSGINVAMDIVVHNNSLYVAGVVNKSGNAFIRIEKRSLKTLAIESVLNIRIGSAVGIVPRLYIIKNFLVIAYTNREKGVISMDFLDTNLNLVNRINVNINGYLYSIVSDNNCIYIGGSFGVAKICDGKVDNLVYLYGGDALSVKFYNESLIALVSTPIGIDSAQINVYALDKNLNILWRKHLNNSYRHLLYIKPVEIVENSIVIASSSSSGFWTLNKFAIPQISTKADRDFITCYTEVVIVLSYLLTMAIIIMLRLLRYSRMQRR